MQWSATVDAAVTAGLQQPLLGRQAPPDDSSNGSSSDANTPGGGGTSSSSRVVVNFPPGLLQLMREAKYLDQLGCAVPQLAVNLALQEGQLRCVRRAACWGGSWWCGKSQDVQLRHGALSMLWNAERTQSTHTPCLCPQAALSGAGCGAGAAPRRRRIAAGC